MNKIGLVLELIGFLMLFKTGKLLSGGDTQDEIIRFLWWIPHEPAKEWICKKWEKIALGFVAMGVVFQIAGCQ